MDQQLNRLQGHVDYLIDLYIGLREKYAFLCPMLFSKQVVDRWSKGPCAYGFNVIKSSLLYVYMQDIAKIISDKDDRSPSLHKVSIVLAEGQIRDKLRERFSTLKFPMPEDAPDELRALIVKIEAREQAKRAKLFNRIYRRFTKRWDNLNQSQALRAFETIRDKLTAHNELNLKNGEYKPLDVTGLGLKWGDLRKMIRTIALLVRDTNLLVQNASFDFDRFDKSLTSASRTFWRSTVPADHTLKRYRKMVSNA